VSKPCNSTCCTLSAYWRELANADHARAERIAEERDGLQHIVDHLRLALREREAEIASMAKRRKPAASEYAVREMRRRA